MVNGGNQRPVGGQTNGNERMGRGELRRDERRGQGYGGAWNGDKEQFQLETLKDCIKKEHERTRKEDSIARYMF